MKKKEKIGVHESSDSMEADSVLIYSINLSMFVSDEWVSLWPILRILTVYSHVIYIHNQRDLGGVEVSDSFALAVRLKVNFYEFRIENRKSLYFSHQGF